MTPESHNPEPAKDREVEAPLALDALPAQLGLIETPALTQLREGLIEAAQHNPESVVELATRYHRLAQEVVGERTGADFGKAQIGLIIAMGLIWRDAGQLDKYHEELESARLYADYEDLVAVVETLDVAMAKEG